VNKNSTISETEFIEGLVELNVNLSELEMRQVFNELDRLGRGHLTFEDFCGLV
jgi:Ca2+-binding EF-hand superfamily protein